MQPLPPSIWTFSSSQAETLCPLHRNSPWRRLLLHGFSCLSSQIYLFTFVIFSLFCCGRPSLRIVPIIDRVFSFFYSFAYLSCLFQSVGMNLIFLFQIVTELFQCCLLACILMSLFWNAFLLCTLDKINLVLSLGTLFLFQCSVLFLYSSSQFRWLVKHFSFIFIIFNNNFVKLQKQILGFFCF